MTTEGNINVLKGIPSIEDAFVVIVRTEWNQDIIDRLLEGCTQVLDANGIRYKIFTVPGAVEIPFAIKSHADNNVIKADAYIALGAVIQGGTPHFDYVCKFVTEGILQLNLTISIPVVFGVLTLNSKEQAFERTGGIHGHKGEEAAITAIKMIALNRDLGM